MAKTVNLTSGNIRTLILQFTWPVFVSRIFSELYNITNSMIVGNYVSLKALSAVSACSWICNIFNYAFYGLGLGSGILVARYYGANDKENLKKSLDTSLVFALVGGLSLTLISELCLPVLMDVCNISSELYADAYSYLRVYLLGNTCVLTYQMCFFILRSLGDTKHQLYYSVIGSFINIGLGILFVRVLNLNVVGTSLATIISQFIMNVLALRLMFNYEGLDFSIKNINFEFSFVKRICALGIPAGIQNMLIAISSMLVQSYVNLFPNEVIAGIGVGEKVVNWGQLASVSVSAATVSLVAQNVGAQRYDRVRETIKESLSISTGLTIVVCVLLFILAPTLVGSFNDNVEVLAYGTQMVRLSIFGMIFINYSHIYNGACRGAGNVRSPMIIAVFGQVICKFLFVYIGLKIFYDVHILYFGSAFGYMMAGIFATIYFRKSRWTFENQLRL